MQDQLTLKVLVADDESDVRAMVRHCLSDPRFEIMEAVTGEAAMDCNPLDLHLLITDEVMEGIHGHELARHLRSLNANLKVLYLTGHADYLFDAKPAMSDREAFLEKPFTPTGLREAVALLMTARLTF